MITLVAQIHANELHLIVDGKAYHFTTRNYNEKNYGLGLEYDFKSRKHWITFVNNSTFKDSLEKRLIIWGCG